ncbi:hypothetical protein H1D32_05575 [Anaerobacillus sp. CMMVII]|uniref:hypothetical protein n=1 Tax=Anaerobacillus sp. CMMVII TaxID=2755588 RepID=UPI0021B81FB2|nr:hypothetical protein [Anaerobacillus sp. CMMVII]MCT8137260.1 hypothetical protein [Anaerobacillus sp. CMMVII]
MEKTELLIKLREYLFSGEIAKGVYIDVNVEKEPRYSPVGFLLKEFGLSDLDLVYLTESMKSTLDIKGLLTGEVKLPERIVNKVKVPLTFLGFNEADLSLLEEKNDGLVHEELYIAIFDLLNNDQFDYNN